MHYKLRMLMLLVTICLEDVYKVLEIDKSVIHLEIIVLSAISNHQKRQAIRQTWGRSVQLVNELSDDVSINLRFIVGTSHCQTHPLSRIDPLSCETNAETNSENELNRVWNKKMESMKKETKIEAQTYGDIEFVKMIDVYRELPEKLLLSFEKLLDNLGMQFTHLLKTDDDCYINILPLIDLIRMNKHEKFAWFGNFRKNWPVNRIGKWKDDLYSAPVYPEFACGSGYVLTRDIVNWINKNSMYLKRFQGEDVSIGIWLEPLKIKKIEDKRFICGEEKLVEDRFLSAPQLLPEMLNQTHERVMSLNNQFLSL